MDLRYVCTAAAPWILIHPAFPRVERERQGSVISHLCFITSDVTPGTDHLASPILALLHASHSNMFTPPHVCSAWHMTLSPPQYNPVTAFFMLFRNPVTQWKGHTHTLQHTPGHSLMHEQPDMTPCVSQVTPLQSSHAVNTHYHPWGHTCLAQGYRTASSCREAET